MMELRESLLSRLGHLRAMLYERWQLLSPREQEVTALTGRGYTNRQMAARLVASPRRRGMNMKFDPNNRHRKSIRLKGYDYLQAGGYFVTIVTQLRESFFGKICDGEMLFNDAGRMVNIESGGLQERFPNIETDVFQVMPNHLHGIIIIHNPESVRAGHVPAHLDRGRDKDCGGKLTPSQPPPSEIHG